MTAMGGRGAGAVPMSRGGVVPGTGRLMTGQAGGGTGGEARPMTSVSGAGYQGSIKDKNFDPLHMGKGPAPPLAEKSESSHEDKARDMEKKIHRQMEGCAELLAAKDMQAGLERAKETAKAERALSKFRESHGLSEQINIDLTYAVCLNLAHAYHMNKMYEDALNTYQLIVKNKLYPHAGRLRVNMGNIYYEQKKFTQAIKMYRMALDQVPATSKELRYKISKNIGNAFVRLGQFQDAIDSYDTVISGSPDIETAFNLLLCLYARGDKDKMKKHFVKMLGIPIPGMTEEDEEKFRDGAAVDIAVSDSPDALREELRRRFDQANDFILTAARLIAPIIDDGEDWIQGYKWVMEQLRNDYEVVSSKLEIDVAMMYMRKRKFEDAIDVLKSFEKKDAALRAMAGTNLSFIYFLEGEYAQAEKHADFAIRSDRYNAKALVNKGNCLFMMGEYFKAKEYYLEAIGVEADCVEAIFNLGITNLKLNAAMEAHQAFDKMFTILPNAPEALFQMACIYENSPELEQAAKVFEMLLNKIPGDPNVCAHLGQIYEKLEDDNAACHWMTEAHRFFPVNLNVISWLGVWYVKREMYDDAIRYFEMASAVQPGEVKWQLMVTSCYRRLGDYSKALELYMQVRFAFCLLYQIYVH
jgi:intraflagellar transport protein 88